MTLAMYDVLEHVINTIQYNVIRKENVPNQVFVKEVQSHRKWQIRSVKPLWLSCKSA
jgi:hypothetical protein